MALEQITFNLGALDDAANSGKNYVSGQVFEVFNIDDTYADIFADSAGTIPIDQSGIQNISNSDGECKFFIDKGFYNIKSGGKARQLNANFSFEFENVSDAINARFISLLEGRRVFIVERNAYFYILNSPSLIENGADIIKSTTSTNIFIVLDYDQKKCLTLSNFGAKTDGSDSSAFISAWVAKLKELQKPAFAIGEYSTSQTIDIRGFYGKFQLGGMTRCVFTITSDNIEGFICGADSQGGSGEHGANIGGFRVIYENQQSVTDTNSNGVTFEYFRYSIFNNVEVQNACRGFYAASTPVDNHFFSNNIDNLKARSCTKNYYAISSGSGAGNTGNVIGNLYASGNRSDVENSTCEQVYLFERMSDGVINQINAEWIKPTRALVFNRCSPRVNGVHLEGLSAAVNNGAFVLLIGSSVDMTIRAKTCNFSGGDPETNEVGTINNFSLFQLQPDVGTSKGSFLNVIGSNDNCTASLTNSYFASSTDAYSFENRLLATSWIDEDGIIQDSNGRPFTNFTPAQPNGFKSVIRSYNDNDFKPYFRGNDSSGQTANSIVLLNGIENVNNCYDTATGKFEVFENGVLNISINLESSGDAELRFEDSLGTENTAKRVFIGGNGIYINGSYSEKVDKGEKAYIYLLTSPSTANNNSKCSFHLT